MYQESNKTMKTNSPTLGVIYGNRDFFPDQLVTEARADIAQVFAKLGIQAIQLGESDSKLGGVETHADARKCAELFRRHAREIDGVLVCLPNFGDEKGVADTLKLAGLNVAGVGAGVSGRFEAAFARRAAGTRFAEKSRSATTWSRPASSFHSRANTFRCRRRRLLKPICGNFLGVCRVVNGVRGVRLGAVGARPGAFNTVRYSEKILERHGISVTTVDLSEILGKAGKLDAQRRRRESQAGRNHRLRARARRAAGKTVADGEAGRGAHRLDGRQLSRRHRHPMLDFGAAELRLQRLHR